MLEPVPPTVILLIATFCTIIIISAIILFLTMNKTSDSSSQEARFAEDLQMYEEQYGEGRERFTFVYNPRCGGYAVVGGGPRTGEGEGQMFGGGRDEDSEGVKRGGSSIPDLRTKSTSNSKSSLRSWLFGVKRSASAGSASGKHARAYSRNELRESHSDLRWDDDDGGEGTIHISPSRPAMFGTPSDEGRGEEGGGVVKVMLTPPTPAKERVFRAVLVSDSRESM